MRLSSAWRTRSNQLAQMCQLPTQARPRWRAQRAALGRLWWFWILIGLDDIAIEHAQQRWAGNMRRWHLGELRIQGRLLWSTGQTARG